MAKNPLNLTLRFLLELLALFSMGRWGWVRGSGLLRPVLALAIPALAAAVWGIFRVPEDPGRAPVPVPGILRLLIEVAFFGLAVAAQQAAVGSQVAALFGIVVLLHYIISYDRVLWLLKQ